MKVIIHVNQHVIKSNKANNKRDPCLTVKSYKDTIYCDEVDIRGASQTVYRPDKPLSCGAHVWIETEAHVVCKVGKETVHEFNPKNAVELASCPSTTKYHF